MSSPPGEVVLRDVTLSYNDHPLTMRMKVAVDQLNATIRPGVITALCGPNAAGKTSLATAIAGWQPVTSGAITIDGLDPRRDTELRRRVVYTDGVGAYRPTARISDELAMWDAARPTFDLAYATSLLASINVDPKDRVKSLSTGKRAGLAMATALACRADVTIFDEVHNGMDANTRQFFLDRLVEAYAEHPRTFIISSHLISEIDRVAEDVMVLNASKLVCHESADDLRERLVSVIGKADVVQPFTASHPVLSRQVLGPLTHVTVDAGAQAHALRSQAEARGLDLAPVSLQDAIIALTSTTPTDIPASQEGRQS